MLRTGILESKSLEILKNGVVNCQLRAHSIISDFELPSVKC